MSAKSDKLESLLHCVLESVKAHLRETGYVADPNNLNQMDLDMRSADEYLTEIDEAAAAKFDKENPSR